MQSIAKDGKQVQYRIINLKKISLQKLNKTSIAVVDIRINYTFYSYEYLKLKWQEQS